MTSHQDDRYDGPAENPSESSTSWVTKRERLVQLALDDGDIDGLRRISALPGGFGSQWMRRKVWPVLLDTQRFLPTDSSPESASHGSADTQGLAGGGRPTSLDDPPPHPDEAQVLLDTKRSFVSYPTGIRENSKLVLQAELHQLIIETLRRYPQLSYFQGYHDIMSVLYLTYIDPPTPRQPRSRVASGRNTPRSQTPRGRRSLNGDGSPADASAERKDRSVSSSREVSPTGQLRDGSTPPVGRDEKARDVHLLPYWETLEQCAAVLSVCRVRDAMGKGMDPMMGLLKVLRRLLRAADPELSRFSSAISPVPTLPFFALSWILCLYSHDIDTLEPIQRMFDFLLARNPISAIYLAVAILMAKKKQMLQLARKLGPEARDDPTLLHPLFSRLPPLYPDTPVSPLPPKEIIDEKTDYSEYDQANPYQPIPLSRVFNLTEELLARFPWDGSIIRGREIMGPDSVICTYDEEPSATNKQSLDDLQRLVDGEVVLPGAADIDDEAELPPVRWRLRFPRNRLGTAVAVGVVVVGIGMAVYGARNGGSGGWRSWWHLVRRFLARSDWVRYLRRPVGLLQHVAVRLRDDL